MEFNYEVLGYVFEFLGISELEMKWKLILDIFREYIGIILKIYNWGMELIIWFVKIKFIRRWFFVRCL